jgi:hypothetical protein
MNKLCGQCEYERRAENQRKKDSALSVFERLP